MVKHVVHMHVAVVHLHAGVVHAVVHMMQNVVVAGKGIGRKDEGKGECGRCDSGGLHG